MLTLFATIILLGVVIFIHELGHFIAAKIGKVKVEKFSIGFPPTIISKRFGETEYAIGAIPFGGYVRMAGEKPDSTDLIPEPGDLSGKPVLTRAFIIAAGPIMNIALAFFLFWAVLSFHGTGYISDAPVIGGIIPDSPADTAGLVENDTVLSVNDIEVSSWGQIAEIVHPRPGEETAFMIKRADSVFAINITPIMREVATDTGKTEMGLIGIQPTVFFEPMGPLRGIFPSVLLLGDVFAAIWQFVTKALSTGLEEGDVGGPVLIAKMAGASAQSGWAAFLFFMAALSVNLGILNLIPIPVLDGGHLAFLFIETLRRKPVSFKFRLVAQQVGFLIIIALMIYVTVNDIFFVFKG